MKMPCSVVSSRGKYITENTQARKILQDLKK